MSTGNPKRLIHFLPLFLLSACLAIFSCNQQKPVAADNEKPEDSRFTKVVLAEGFDEPMEMTFLNDGRVLIVERKGGLKSVDTKTKAVKTIATIPVNTKYISKEGAVSEAEEGLMGIIAHPDFAKNHWIYLYYADPTDTKHVLARWELHGDSLYGATKKVILEVGTQRETCCHTGGGMAFDQEGNLYLTVGNNTANPISGIASYDERPGKSSWDDQRGSGSTNDLRGKILRIHPEKDGSYTIPQGNLFPKGTNNTRPEIYIMGNRNPWRVSVDSKTGWIYWGEVGPDAAADSVWGSRGYDEFNQAKKAGYFGWPYFIGDNHTYAKYNYADNTYGEKFNPEHPLNNSPNNTGLKELPPAQKPLIWYPYAASDSFSIMGSGGRSAVGGPIFHQADFKNAARPWPAYYEDKWLITDFIRGWLMSVTMNPDGSYKSMEQALPAENFSSAIDMKFGPDGDLYFLEYGSAWFKGNANSALVRIEYNSGNRKPVVEASADKMAGAIPLQVNLSSKGTIDYDNYDKEGLKYEWKISGNGVDKTLSEPNPSVTLDKPGNYEVALTVTDSKGEKNSKSLKLVAGNEPPTVSVNILKGNKTFFFPNEQIDYSIDVSDKEDGSVAAGSIKPDLVAVNFDYVPQGFDPIEIAQHHRAADEKTGFNAGLYLINSKDCKSCHLSDKTSVGPSYVAIAEKYKDKDTALSRLASKVISGGFGVWGDHPMSAHPNLTVKDAETMVKYILGLSRKQTAAKPLPLKGTFVTKIPTGENENGGYLFRAAYVDKGNSSVSPISSEATIALRSPSVDPKKADVKKNTELLTTPTISFSMIGDGSYIGFNNIDLSGIKQIQFLVQATPNTGDAGGVIEVHLDAPDGKLLGKTEIVIPKELDFARLMELMGPKANASSKNAKSSTNQKQGDTSKKQSATIDLDFDLLDKLMSSQVTATLVPVEGMHTIYFVFKNSQAKSKQSLMKMSEIKFQNAANVSAVPKK